MIPSAAPITDADLHAYADERLTPERAAEVAAYLSENPEAAEAVDTWRRQTATLKALFDPVLDESVPERLRAIRPRAAAPWWTRAAAAVLLLAVGAAAGWTLRGTDIAQQRRELTLARVAADAHRLYVAEVRHPVEVSAKEEKHLVAWLTKRLGVPVRAPTLAEAGFHLMGGRLLPGDGKPAAQFMYENAEGRRLTLYVRRGGDDGGQTAFRFVAEGPAQGFYWIDGPLGYALMGDIGRDRLLAVSNMVYRQINP